LKRIWLNSSIGLNKGVSEIIVGETDTITIGLCGHIVDSGRKRAGFIKKIPFTGGSVQKIAGCIEEFCANRGCHLESICNQIVEPKKIKTGGHLLQ